MVVRCGCAGFVTTNIKPHYRKEHGIFPRAPQKVVRPSQEVVGALGILFCSSLIMAENACWTWNAQPNIQKQELPSYPWLQKKQPS